MSTKIHARTDALGNPVGFHLTGGEAHDLEGAGHLLADMAAETLIADKAFDADERVRDPLAKAGKAAVILPRANRKLPADFDRHLYQARHLIENFLARLKQRRAIVTRYDKTACYFPAAIHLDAAIVWLNWRQAPALLWHLYDHDRCLYQTGIRRRMRCVPPLSFRRRP